MFQVMNVTAGLGRAVTDRRGTLADFSDFTRYVGVEKDSVASPLDPNLISSRKVSNGGTYYPQGVKNKKISTGHRRLKRRASRSTLARNLAELRELNLKELNDVVVQGVSATESVRGVKHDQEAGEVEQRRECDEVNKSAEVSGTSEEGRHTTSQSPQSPQTWRGQLPLIPERKPDFVRAKRSRKEKDFVGKSGRSASVFANLSPSSRRGSLHRAAMESLKAPDLYRPGGPSRRSNFLMPVNSPGRGGLDDIAEDTSYFEDSPKMGRRQRHRDRQNINDVLKNIGTEIPNSKCKMKTKEVRESQNPSRKISRCSHPSQTNLPPNFDGGARRRTDAPIGTAAARDKPRRGTWAAFDNEASNIMSKFTKPGEARTFFRRASRKILLVLQWMKVLSKQDEKIETQLKTFFDMAQELDDYTPMKHIEEESGLSFDPRHYRAKKAVHLTAEQKRVLTLATEYRSPDMIQKVLAGLHHLEAFAEYPLHMQEKLARVAWYSELPSKRMIIRQGHKAENFYFILSGSAMAKQLVRDEATGRVNMRMVGRMQRGESFGEVALVQHSERTATVESVTSMQLLVVSREDFMDIFFSRANGEEPDHITFCRSLDFLKDWPIEKCLDEPRSCLFHYFRRGTVIISDSRKNEWIYIVKTGTCVVLKKLKAVCAQRNWTASKSIDIGNLSREHTISGYHLSLKYVALISRQALFHAEMNHQFSDTFNTENTEYNFFHSRLPAKSTTSMSYLGEPSQKARSLKSAVTFSDEVFTSDREKMPQTEPDTITIAVPQMPSVAHPKATETPKVRVQTPGFSKSKFNSLPGINDANARSSEVMVGIQRYTSAPLSLSPRYAVTSGSRMSRSLPQPEPCFVQLKKLRSGDVFGLEETVLQDDNSNHGKDTSVTLVSNGAELVMLSRKFFLKHATETVKKYIREICRPFPDEDTLQENLQDAVNWELYRKEMVDDLLEYRSEIKLLVPA